MLVLYKYAILIVLFIVFNKRFIWSQTKYRYYRWLVHWNSSSLILCLKYRFLLPILFHLSIYGCYLGSGFETWETNLVNHEIPRISLFTIFRRWEVSLNWYLIDCYVSIFVVRMNGEWIFLLGLRPSLASVGLNHAYIDDTEYTNVGMVYGIEFVR